LSLLCGMRLLGTALLLFTCLLATSCTSEYEERLEEAKVLRERFLIVEESNFLTPSGELTAEMKQIESEIEFLAKVSGNEELFLLEIKRY
jgi:hypothetical protein